MDGWKNTCVGKLDTKRDQTVHYAEKNLGLGIVMV